MPFWCKGKKDYCQDNSSEACNACQYEDGSGGIELDDDDDIFIGQWISVKDKVKPRHGKEYLCVCTLPDDPKHEWDWMAVLRWHMNGSNGYIDRPHFTNEGVNGMTVTHWTHLPAPPKEN